MRPRPCFSRRYPTSSPWAWGPRLAEVYMTWRVPNEWVQFKYLDPRKILVGLREIEENYPLNDLRYQARTLRTRELRKFGEGRQAALFCYGMSLAIGKEVSFALKESQDFDCIARYEIDGVCHYVPIQLKEWAPEHLPSPKPLQMELDKLLKYADCKDLVVGFYMNRAERVVLSKLSFPRTLKELWFFGASEANQASWVLIGNLLADRPLAHEFSYPTRAEGSEGSSEGQFLQQRG